VARLQGRSGASPSGTRGGPAFLTPWDPREAEEQGSETVTRSEV